MMIESKKAEAVAVLGAIVLAVSIAFGAAAHAGLAKRVKQVARTSASAETGLVEGRSSTRKSPSPSRMTQIR